MSTIKPNQNSNEKKTIQVEKMFDSIALTYDKLNKILSLNMDRNWRKYLVKKVMKTSPKHILDIATGTGDIAIQLAKSCPSANITGIDLSKNMLDIAKQKSKGNITFQQENAEQLKFKSNTFDCATVTFGIRNFEHLEKGLKESHRILNQKGKLLILEFGQPKNIFFKLLFNLYSNTIIPAFSSILSKRKGAYSYLVKSSKHFPCGTDMEKVLLDSGFSHVYSKPLTFGVCYFYEAVK